PNRPRRRLDDLACHCVTRCLPYEIYSTLSCRRFMSDIRNALSKGLSLQAAALQFNLQLSGKSRTHTNPVLVDHRNELALEICGGGFCRRFVRLHHVVLRGSIISMAPCDSSTNG